MKNRWNCVRSGSGGIDMANMHTCQLVVPLVELASGGVRVAGPLHLTSDAYCS